MIYLFWYVFISKWWFRDNDKSIDDVEKNLFSKEFFFKLNVLKDFERCILYLILFNFSNIWVIIFRILMKI